MDFKKILSGTVLSFLIGSSFTAQALDRPAPGLDVEEGEVPILSPKQLSKQMKDFKKYLNKVQRCLFTGPCTKEEKAQVWRHGKRLMKYVALAGGAVLFYHKGVPLVQKGYGATRKFFGGEFEAAVEKVKGGVKEVGQQAEETVESLKKKLPEGVEGLLEEVAAGEAAFGAYPSLRGIELKVRRKEKAPVPPASSPAVAVAIAAIRAKEEEVVTLTRAALREAATNIEGVARAKVAEVRDSPLASVDKTAAIRAIQAEEKTAVERVEAAVRAAEEAQPMQFGF